MGAVLLGQVESEISQLIRASAVGWQTTDVLDVSDLDEILARLDQREDSIDALVLGAVFEEPVRVAQRVHSGDRDLSVLILTDSSCSDQLEQALQFSPFLGPEISCWSKSSVAGFAEALGEAVVRTRQRRHYRTMMDASKQETTALRPRHLQAGEYLDRLLDHAPIGVVLLDARGLTAGLNRWARDLLDVSERQALGRSLSEFVPGAAAKRLAGLLSRCASSERRTPPERFERQRRAGTAQVLELTGAAISSSSGHQCTMVILQDVTERAQVELRQRRLKDELDHRVKNALATVIALTDQTLAAARSPEDFAVSFTGRIHALGRVHEALAAAQWKGVDLAEIVRLTLEPHVHDAWTRVRVKGEQLLLPARAASALCMTLHELATNAAKHGALTSLHGSVGIEWRCDGDGTLRLAWVESGGPPASRTGTGGLGSVVIKELVRYELSGEVELDFRETGLRCSIIVPPRKEAP